MKLTKSECALVDALFPSPNFEERAFGYEPSMLIMHYTGMASVEKAISWLATPESKVSCHYVVDEEGTITQMVSEGARAWHAGKSYWSGETDINSASIGIEIQNPGHEDGYHDFPRAQMAAVLALSHDIIGRHGIPAQRVLAHSDIAPARKIDPGEKFNWRYLFDGGVGHWVAPEPVDTLAGGIARGQDGALIARAQELLRDYGYGVEVSGRNDEPSRQVVSAFQRHFRPARVDGIVDPSTIATLERLLAALGAPVVS